MISKFFQFTLGVCFITLLSIPISFVVGIIVWFFIAVVFALGSNFLVIWEWSYRITFILLSVAVVWTSFILNRPGKRIKN